MFVMPAQATYQRRENRCSLLEASLRPGNRKFYDEKPLQGIECSSPDDLLVLRE